MIIISIINFIFKSFKDYFYDSHFHYYDYHNQF